MIVKTGRDYPNYRVYRNKTIIIVITRDIIYDSTKYYKAVKGIIQDCDHIVKRHINLESVLLEYYAGRLRI